MPSGKTPTSLKGFNRAAASVDYQRNIEEKDAQCEIPQNEPKYQPTANHNCDRRRRQVILSSHANGQRNKQEYYWKNGDKLHDDSHQFFQSNRAKPVEARKEITKAPIPAF